MAQQVASLYADIGAKTDKFEKGAATVKGGLYDIVSVMALVTAAVSAMDAAYEFSRAGAQLQMVENRFDRLSSSIGTTSDALLNDLQKATRGLYSDAELMASASDLMALGLAKSHDEAVRLASVSAGLNMNMNQLVLTLTNMTTMRFDALGVSVDGFKEKVAELEKQGYSTNDAFKEAFLQQAENQLEKVGHAADNNIGAFMRLEAQMKDNADAAKMMASDGISPLIDYLADSTEEINKNKEVLSILNEELYKEYSAHKVLTPEMEALIAQYERGVAMTALYAEETEKATGIIEDQAQAQKDMNAANEEFLNLLGTISENRVDFEEEQADLINENMELESEKQSLIAQGWGLESEKIQDINAKIDENNAKYAENAAAFEIENKKIMLGYIERKLTADGVLDDKELIWLTEKGVAWGVYHETAVAEVEAMINEANGLIEGLVTEKSFTLSLNTIYNEYGDSARPVGGPRAKGGPVSGGMMYPVNEEGMPELLNFGGKQMLMMPESGNGYVTPMSAGAGGGAGGGVIVNIMLDSATPDPERVAYQLAPAVERVLRSKKLI